MVYTVIYSTPALKGIQYSTEAENLKEMIRFVAGKFQTKEYAIIENQPDESEDFTRGRLVCLNGVVVNGTFDVVFNDDTCSNNVGVNGAYSECMLWIENHRNDPTSYFGDYKGGSVSVVCNDTDECYYIESIP